MPNREDVLALLRQLGLDPQDLKADPTVAWLLKVNYPAKDGPDGLLVLSPAGGPDYVVVQSVLGVADGHRAALRGLGDDRYRQFRFDLLRDLLLSGADYQAKFDDAKKDLQSVVLARRLWPDSLTLTGLDGALSQVFDATVLCRLHVRRMAGEVA